MSDSKLIDKTYVRAKGMLFNITGYDHPEESLYCSLKYVGDVKWKQGYAAAREWLKSNHPEFVGDYIHVPRHLVSEVFYPQERWRDLCAQPRTALCRLHCEALDLAAALSVETGIDINEFGITDSLLWGEGHEQSDIDLVVFGPRYTQQLLAAGESLYKGEFSRPDPLLMTAPYSLKVADWPALLDRKRHMGEFRGRFFSLRTVLTAAEMLKMPRPAVGGHASSEMKQEVEFEIADDSWSLCFPAIYRDKAGNQLVDYSVVYEGVFRSGESVRARCTVENLEASQTVEGQPLVRYIIDGPCQLLDRSSCS